MLQVSMAGTLGCWQGSGASAATLRIPAVSRASSPKHCEALPPLVAAEAAANIGVERTQTCMLLIGDTWSHAVPGGVRDTPPSHRGQTPMREAVHAAVGVGRQRLQVGPRRAQPPAGKHLHASARAARGKRHAARRCDRSGCFCFRG